MRQPLSSCARRTWRATCAAPCAKTAGHAGTDGAKTPCAAAAISPHSEPRTGTQSPDDDARQHVADQRIAAFLLDLSQRFAARGYSPAEFILRMTRAKIGNYLGLTLETVSRGLSQMQRGKLIEVLGQHIRITDLAGLKAAASRRAGAA